MFKPILRRIRNRRNQNRRIQTPTLPSIGTITETQQHPSRLLQLPTELLLMILEEVAKISKHDLIQVSMCCKQLRKDAEKFVFENVELISNVYEPNPNCAALAQGKHRVTRYDGVPKIFLETLPPFLEHTRSLAFHDFFSVDGVAFWRVAWDIAKLLLVPKQLQALEIHVDDGTAMRLEYALEQKGVEFPHLQDITLSINLRFLLNYAPNVRRLSNRPRETWRSAKRRFEGREWQELFELCSELHWLETLDLYLGTEIPRDIKIPPLRIKKLRIAKERSLPSPGVPRTKFDFIDLLMPFIDTLPQLVTIELPETSETWSRWPRHGLISSQGWDDEYYFMMPCAIIALKFSHLDTIKVGKNTIKVKFDEEAGRVTVEHLKPEGNIMAGEVEVREVCKGLHDPAIWVEKDKITHKKFLAVNPKCEILSR
ncbi:hypothetical protein HDK90DRAFT_545086 [Phyllosticta capitalensis]|uniref:F-box domain-containing protein n=1 Tax=Phyllosticta capitalensis TaxID=121624 RepID=A0ABR1YAI5_9PEZI